MGDILANRYSDARLKLFSFDAEHHDEYVKQQINMVEQAKINGNGRIYNRELTTLKKYFDVCVCISYYRDKNEFYFYIVGNDLIQVLQDIPYETIDFNKTKKPKCGTRHARFYNYKYNKENMIRIATELRTLQEYIVPQKTFLSDDTIIKKNVMTRKEIGPIYDTGILGIDVYVDTKKLEEYDNANSTVFFDLIKENLSSKYNPKKIGRGEYIFNKNGTNIDIMRDLSQYYKNLNNVYHQYVHINPITEKSTDIITKIEKSLKVMLILR